MTYLEKCLKRKAERDLWAPRKPRKPRKLTAAQKALNAASAKGWATYIDNMMAKEEAKETLYIEAKRQANILAIEHVFGIVPDCVEEVTPVVVTQQAAPASFWYPYQPKN